MKYHVPARLISTLLFATFPLPIRAAEDPIENSLREADTDHNGALSSAEVTAGLRRRLGLAPGTNTKGLAKELALWQQAFGPGPEYKVETLAAHPYYNEKLFGLGKEEPRAVVDTVHLWVSTDKNPFKLRRTFDDFTEADSNVAKGAQISYIRDFNAKSDQWAFHGIVGYSWSQKKNTNIGGTPEGVRANLDPNRDRGVVERWIMPSVQWDKVNTSPGDADEIDSLIFRLTTGLKVAAKNRKERLFDGLRFDLSASYATDSNAERGVLGGELDVKPFKDQWDGLGVGLNGAFKSVGIFRLRPELAFHAEGGAVLDDAGRPGLIDQQNFMRLGAMVGISVRFEQRFHWLRGLLLHAGLQYYADITNSGSDADLFSASADWALDDNGRYTLTALYRNGRSPFVVERDNRLTLGVGLKF